MWCEMISWGIDCSTNLLGPVLQEGYKQIVYRGVPVKRRKIVCGVIEQNGGLAFCQKILVSLGIRSAASFPQRVLGRIKGTINFYADQPGFFDQGKISLLEELAMDISFAMEFTEKELERKRVEEALRKSEDYF
jgi:GAF domain-containing protein